MLTAALLVSLVVAISLHELGHAIAMRECNVPIERISLLGLGTERMGMITLPIKSTFFPGTKWVVHPLIVGAYVKPDEKAMGKISGEEEMYIFGMGPLVNIILGVVLLGCFMVVRSLFIMSGQHDLMVALASLIATLVTTYALLRYRRFLCRYALLPVGVVCLFVSVWFLYGLTAEQWQYLSGGPLTIGVVVNKAALSITGDAGTLAAFVFYFAGTMSISLGLTNLIPIPPLDGGGMSLCVLKKLVSERVLGVYQGIGTCLIIALLLLALYNDLAIIGGFFGLDWTHL